MTPRSPYLTLDEAAAYLRKEQTKNPRQAAWKFCKTRQVPMRAGGLVLPSDLEEALKPKRRTRSA